MALYLDPKLRSRAARLRSDGLPWKDIARELGCSLTTAWQTNPKLQRGAWRPEWWTPGPGRLSFEEREEIMVGLARRDTFTAIAVRIGRAVSTVSRELAANGGREGYRAMAGHRRACTQARRPKASKLSSCPRLAETVVTWLEQLWSPEEIAHRLHHEFEGDPMMQVSHETIYQALYVQGRGELRRELHRCLRSGRARRRPRGDRELRGKIPNMVMISERPAEVADRAVPGHWEGDLILGRKNESAVGTLVERSTRYVLLLHLPEGRTAMHVEAAMKQAILSLPKELFRTITWDQGPEMARHAIFTIDTEIPVYFCDPSSPWQRGSNENTNGLLRQYMPKSTDLSVHTAEDLAEFARSLNNRPRKTLGYLKPSEKLAEILATTG
jgi:transposase, IS30 family